MEVFTPPPYREQRVTGRPPKLTEETRMMVARKVTDKELTYREASKLFGLSNGSVAACVRNFKKLKTYKRRSERKQEENKEITAYRHESQVKELKHQIAELYLENQMLKKFLNRSLQVKKYGGSVITTENLDQLKEDAK